MPNIVNIALTNTFEEWRVKDNEMGTALGDLSNLNLGGVTGDENVVSSLNALRVDMTNHGGWIGNMGTLYGGNTDLTTGVNTNRADITTIAAVANIDISSGSLTNYDGAGTCSDTTYTSKATCETASETWTVAVDQNNDPIIGIIDILNHDYYRLNTHDTEIGTTSSLYNYATYPSLVTSANNLNSRLSDIETDVGDWSTYTDIANDATIVAAMNSIKVIHDDIGGSFVNASGDTMTGKLVANGGIGATTSLILGVGTGTAVTVNDQQRLGIGVASHATYKVDVNGDLNATNLRIGGEQLDDRFIQNSSTGGTATISANIDHTGTTTFTSDVTIGSELVYDAGTFTFSEYISDQIGSSFTSNSESGGISATYNDTTNKITLAIADDGHNHVVGNIDDFTENVQDIVGGMVADPNIEDGIQVTYDDTAGKLNFGMTDPTISISGAVTGSATMTNLGSITINTASAANSIPTSAITDLLEYIQDTVGGMITGNTETGMVVSYNDTSGKVNFDNSLEIFDVNGTQVF
jgi:hypothetical protein